MNNTILPVSRGNRRGGYRSFTTQATDRSCIAIVERIEQLITESGETIAEFADGSGMTTDAMRNRLKFRDFYLKELSGIARHLGTKSSKLFEGLK